MAKTFRVGETVSVPSRDITGEIIELRKNEDGSTDANVRYVVAKARRPYYETWWPLSFLQSLN